MLYIILIYTFSIPADVRGALDTNDNPLLSSSM